MRIAGLTLYHLPTCLFCWRVRFASWRLKINLAMKNVMLSPAAHSELVREGGKMQVPCLRIEENGKVRWLYESADIIAYLKMRLTNDR